MAIFAASPTEILHAYCPSIHPPGSLPANRDHPEAVSALAGNQGAYEDAYDPNDRALNLPSALNFTESEMERVCREMRTLLSSDPALA